MGDASAGNQLAVRWVDEQYAGLHLHCFQAIQRPSDDVRQQYDELSRHRALPPSQPVARRYWPGRVAWYGRCGKRCRRVGRCARIHEEIPCRLEGRAGLLHLRCHRSGLHL